MESSDDSFTWMSASSGSDEESNKPEMTEKHVESESEKSYKKKLHKKLFKTEDDVKQELLNGDSVKPEPDSDAGATPRKRKRKRERTPSVDSTGHEYLQTKVKQEDSEEKPKKLKRRQTENESQDLSQDSQLGANESLVKHESYSEEKPKKRKKRHTETESQDLSQNSELGFQESVDTSVKQESFSEKKPKKRKKRHTENGSQDLSQDSELGAKETLDALVKQESYNDVKPKKHKKRHKEDANESQDLSQESELDTNKSQDDSQNSELDATDHKKKKKSKRKKERLESEMIIEDKFEAEETVVETRPRQQSTNMDVDENQEVPEDSNTDEVMDSPSKSQKGKKKVNKISDRIQFENENRASFTEKDTSDDEVMGSPSKSKKTNEKATKISENRTSITEKDSSDDDVARNRNTDVSMESPSKSKNAIKKPARISERLQFEDDENVVTARNESSENDSQQSSKMRRFLKANPHLQSIQCISNSDSVISKDDDVWLFHCPHEVDVSSLKDTDISLDNKCKIKIDSQTYIGHVENEINSTAILTFEHNRPVIKSVQLQGVVNFKKRIPKPHLFEDNIIENRQTNFIPLPDTKCRHPLFGPDYKNATKIPSSIKSRLQNSDSETSIPKTEKKKKKRKHVENDERDMGVDVPDGIVEEKPSRKRHHSEIVDTDQPVKKKYKKIKKEKNSGESWDSEKAIEDNLFNF
ncbi:DNA-directed RNA polymerase I subunit RPA34.5 domain-containing protein [Phthorimaea operculella]|nr:DNA-directed RNA polymerase I subunit RPA34.5 domain-containing protein [Phthorimaea operculella]